MEPVDIKFDMDAYRKEMNKLLDKIYPPHKSSKTYPLFSITNSKLDELIIDSETGDIEIKKDELYKSSFFTGSWAVTGYSPVYQFSGLADLSKKIDEPSEIS